MFEMKSKTAKMTPKIVFLVPCFVLLAACSSKQIQNASMEPLDMPAEESEYSAPVAPVTPAQVKKFKKIGKKSQMAKNFKKALKKPAAPAAAAVASTESLPVIGDGTMASAPITVPPMAPPVPFDMNAQDGNQPNWILAGLIIAGLVGLIGVAFRVRKQTASRKRRLVYNA